MRVFQVYYFDLKDRVLFKDTLPFVEAWLAGQGIAYGGVAFGMQFVNWEEDRDTPRLLASFPQLEKYHRAKAEKNCSDFTSVPPNWAPGMIMHALKEDEDVIRQAAAKIPRPFNPLFNYFALDDVQWFPKINTIPALYADHTPGASGLYPHLSNRIEMSKAFQSGKKYNEIEVIIERTNTPEELLDDTAILEKLIAGLGTKPRYGAVQIVSSEEERRETEAADVAVAPILEALWTELKPREAVPKDAPPAYHIARMDLGLGEMNVMSLVQGEPVSPKKAIFKAIKGTGLQYKYKHGGFYECVKVNRHNHKFEVSFSLKPMSRYLTFGASISGCNFRVGIPMAHGVDIMHQSVADETARLVVDAALQAQARLENILLQHYGRTPDWYNWP